MGNRASIVFTDGEEYSPVVYLHWNGFEVPDWLSQTRDLMNSRPGDLDYTAARFVGVCHGHIDGPLSLGLSNYAGDIAKHDPGDAGTFVVDVRTWQVQRSCGPNGECDAPRRFVVGKWTNALHKQGKAVGVPDDGADTDETAGH